MQIIDFYGFTDLNKQNSRLSYLATYGLAVANQSCFCGQTQNMSIIMYAMNLLQTRRRIQKHV